MTNRNTAVRTTQGMYAVNHDRYLLDAAIPLYAVLDGDVHNGHGAEVALSALEQFKARIHDAARRDDQEARRTLELAVHGANAAVWAEASTPRWRGCGTTLTCCTVTDTAVVGAHVGDSRLYLRHDDRWCRLSTDHTLVEQYRKNGPPESLAEALEIHSSVILRALGFCTDIAVDTIAVPWAPGDSLLLCTDGAWHLFDPEMKGAGPQGSDPDDVASWVMARHADEGGRTNATVVVVQL